MRKSVTVRTALLFCGVSALALPVMAQAQSEGQEASAQAASSSAGSNVNEIIVTATRRNESLQDVPMTVNVATGEKLSKLNILDVAGVQQLAPGLELTNTTGRNNTTTLRGVSFDPDQGTGPSVRVYFNEAPVDAQTVYTALYDIQQIEVLRGPQGLLRGLSAPAGSITITSRRPNFDKVEGDIQGTATLRNGYNLQGGVSVPLSDKLAFRVAGLIDGNRLNHVRNINRDDQYSRSRTESVRATLGFKPTDDFTAYLSYQYLHAKNRQYWQAIGEGGHPGYIAGCLLGYCSDDGTPIKIPDTSVSSGPPLSVRDRRSVTDGLFERENKSHLVNLNLDWNLGPVTLSAVGAYQYSTLTTNRDIDYGNAVPGYVGASYVKSPYKVWTGELRLTSNETEGFGWGVGAFYTKQTGTTFVQEQNDSFLFPGSLGSTAQMIPGALPYLPITSLVTVPVDMDTLSFSANARYRTGPLKIEGGLRYSIMRSTQTTQLGLIMGPSYFAPGYENQITIPAYEIVPQHLQNHKSKPITGGLNITYEISPSANVYAAYGRAFRQGSTGVSTPAGISDDLIATKNEKTDSYEIGLKGSFGERRWNYSVSAYYQKIKNFLSRFNDIYWTSAGDPRHNGIFQFNYNGNAEVKGVEAELNGRVTDDWDLSVNASYANARYKNAKLPCNDFDGSGVPNQNGPSSVHGGGNVSYCASNGRLAEVPDFSLSANTELRFPMGDVVPFVRGLISYRPGFDSQKVNYKYRDQTLINLYAGVRSEETGWEVSVFVKNVLNQQRISNIALGNFVQAAAFGGEYNSGYRMVSVTNPREAGITASYKF